MPVTSMPQFIPNKGPKKTFFLIALNSVLGSDSGSYMRKRIDLRTASSAGPAIPVSGLAFTTAHFGLSFAKWSLTCFPILKSIYFCDL